MGEPLFRFAGTPVYQPLAALMLWKHFSGSRLISSGVRMDLWIAFGTTIVGGLFFAYLTYWFLSLIRAAYAAIPRSLRLIRGQKAGHPA